jgi:hypothetical protein
MGVLSEPQTCQESHVKETSINFIGKDKNADPSQFIKLCKDYDNESEMVSKLIYRLDKLLEPIYLNAPSTCDQTPCDNEKSYYGDTPLNGHIAEMVIKMRLIRYKLEKIVGSIDLL